MTIYFAGSIRGGRGNQAIYEEIIARLRHYRPTDGRRLSGMIAGCNGVTVHEYARVKDVEGILRQALAPARL